MNHLRRLLQYLRPHVSTLILAMLCMVVVAAATAGTAFVIQPILDDVFVAKNEQALVILPWIVIAIYTTKGVAYFGQGVLMAKTRHSVIAALRSDLYTHILSLPMTVIDRQGKGQLMSRVTYDVLTIEAGLTMLVTGAVRDLLTALFLVALVIYRDPLLAFYTLIVFPLAMMPVVIIARRIKKIAQQTAQNMGMLTSRLEETLGGIRIVKAFGMQRHEAGRFRKMVDELARLGIKTETYNTTSSPIVEMFASFGIALVVYYGGSNVIAGTTTPGNFFSFLTALLMVYEPVKRLSTFNNKMHEGLAAADRVFAIIDSPPETNTGQRLLNRPTGDIAIKGLRFAYPDSKEEALKGIDLTVRQGEVVALVGASGSGKSTLANLIPRFYDPQGGSIEIGGVDIRDMELESLRGGIALVTQEVILFNETLHENIAYGRDDVSPEQVRAAAADAFALEFIEQIPERFEALAGERGGRLSGGQRQRVSIARSLLKDAPILILDEATSALDSESEAMVQQAIDRLMVGRTTLVIAHRLSTIRHADRIVVMQRGEIVEEGKHDELLARNGAYAGLYHMQFRAEQAATS
ncbi:MAG: lipid A export permease/ATP-binding protein MsbA [Alphaproteobacteria bacterium CG_4_10_14_0_2_um_filter_63_37]|nr:MAG: lipid A export permease/ATP-binding protein MsbA [Proteobacteria bacterium CG1_02_64_396]PJA23731.1 MAG: lipid A export permease/ATP-binding protein MsbA [Alphaproteobacteria bacterium CG_4_10_14_0_2_um_filter_63_37]